MFSRRPPVRGVAAVNRVGARSVLGERPPPQQIGVVVAHGADVIHRPSQDVPVLSADALSVRYMTTWINTVSRDHVERGVRGRFTQANHGKPNMLRRMARGDWIIFYSPRTVYPDGDPLQAFTAIGQVADDEPYQADMSPDFQPWRRNVDFLECAETPIRPLIEKLDFIEDKSRWGYKFRFGVFKIDEHDFEVIRSAMGATVSP